MSATSLAVNRFRSVEQRAAHLVRSEPLASLVDVLEIGVERSLDDLSIPRERESALR